MLKLAGVIVEKFDWLDFESRGGPTVPLGELRALTETLGWEREMTLAL